MTLFKHLSPSAALFIFGMVLCIISCVRKSKRDNHSASSATHAPLMMNRFDNDNNDFDTPTTDTRCLVVQKVDGPTLTTQSGQNVLTLQEGEYVNVAQSDWNRDQAAFIWCVTERGNRSGYVPRTALERLGDAH
jgi:hypothetical protein